ncbi:cellulose synthase operon protein YhjQ/BcsQ [Rhodoblastus sp.]|uniref:cellulose synthase operon protein YhjQ/BcsQ n=1 Tax=Rhodoblastus sp. TaxID=1962975 RepID=UPI003F98E893
MSVQQSGLNGLPLDRQNMPLDNVSLGLIRSAGLTDSQIELALAYARAHGVSFLTAAIASGVVTREFVLTSLSKQYNYPIIQNDGAIQAFSRELVVGHEPFGASAEKIRTVRTSIFGGAISRGVRAFVMIGAREGQGASYLAANLAVAFAQMSIATLLVDSNLRDPRLAAMFGVDPAHEGLTDALLTRRVDSPPIVENILPGLSLLPAGGIPPNPQELLCSSEFLALSANLLDRYGVVIYDSPSAMDYSDAYMLAARVGAAIIAARMHHASFDDLKAVSDKLRANQCEIVGTIANSF